MKSLKTIVYHEEIGTLAEKVARVTPVNQLALADASAINCGTKMLAHRAAEIAKFDLVSIWCMNSLNCKDLWVKNMHC